MARDKALFFFTVFVVCMFYSGIDLFLKVIFSTILGYFLLLGGLNWLSGLLKPGETKVKVEALKTKVASQKIPEYKNFSFGTSLAEIQALRDVGRKGATHMENFIAFAKRIGAIPEDATELPEGLEFVISKKILYEWRRKTPTYSSLLPTPSVTKWEILRKIPAEELPAFYKFCRENPLSVS